MKYVSLALPRRAIWLHGWRCWSWFIAHYSRIFKPQAFKNRKNSYFALILEAVIATGLTYVMGQRYMQSADLEDNACWNYCWDQEKYICSKGYSFLPAICSSPAPVLYPCFNGKTHFNSYAQFVNAYAFAAAVFWLLITTLWEGNRMLRRLSRSCKI